ncbi:aminotransferase class I/II-fold pyridoxal phosphate-dependent enzyme [Ferdinandcohnia quinoae]|uniref:Aminotransferase class I/II-fold pyridoxal phosphate-dependent enzyme n=1 Tax=Fredinandcohnia quinoae TaxID=2918902 RepID=A0AAW5EAA2_9BACI|nr:aminotransferase class I/II-fold pyridoxal phosphate-dependent enzyme [Fredinandcohnia sp. SECRCQ15]MCH1626961.1 aminotransferase class I/II-fold pyridoxal phosphate-dependent enzyme [Fredinandcohnia sp. SECRCQ15]
MTFNHTPLFDALYHHSKQSPISMHVPGHKYGAVFPGKGNDYYKEILQIDATELTGLDDLHQPEGPILEAEELAAKLYGVKKTFFLVNGSTVGNLAMILAATEKNNTVLVQRNSHKSIINGLKLAGVNPVFLHPEYDEDVQVPTYVSFTTVKKAFEKYPHTKALILTSPNYFGMANLTELKKIISFAHSHQIPVLVDEAHGAHFILEDFPESAITLGADIVVHSAHKTLPAMTMGSFLHVNSKIIDATHVQSYLQMLQSSSPSYPIMASLDLARHYLGKIKAEGTIPIIASIKNLKESVKRIPQIKLVESNNQSIHTDPLKMTLQTQCSFNGYQLQHLFEKEGIFTELADPNHVLFVLPLAIIENVEDFYQLLNKSVSHVPLTPETSIGSKYFLEKITTLSLSYQEIKGYNKRVVSIENAVGEISAEMIIPYPPGIPLIMEGERITEKHLEVISLYLETGARFQGGNMKDMLITTLEK